MLSLLHCLLFHFSSHFPLLLRAGHYFVGVRDGDVVYLFVSSIPLPPFLFPSVLSGKPHLRFSTNLWGRATVTGIRRDPSFALGGRYKLPQLSLRRHVQWRRVVARRRRAATNPLVNRRWLLNSTERWGLLRGVPLAGILDRGADDGGRGLTLYPGRGSLQHCCRCQSGLAQGGSVRVLNDSALRRRESAGRRRRCPRDS